MSSALVGGSVRRWTHIYTVAYDVEEDKTTVSFKGKQDPSDEGSYMFSNAELAKLPDNDRRRVVRVALSSAGFPMTLSQTWALVTAVLAYTYYS